jgi:hypothetical protein
MNTTAGNTAMHCAHCGRPCASAVWIGSLPYHQECMRGPGYQADVCRLYPPHPDWHHRAPAHDLTENDVRRIVREELAARDKTPNVRAKP